MTFCCPLCHNHVERLLFRFEGRDEARVVTKLQSLHAGWHPLQGLCERCLYLNEYDTLEEHFRTREHGTLFRRRVGNEFALLPTPLRLDADPRFRGKGTTIAFIDSGFYPHPDLVMPVNRVVAIVDVTNERKQQTYFEEPHLESWHGMMTSAVAIGNGYLSKGLYRGIASEATAVLIKTMDTVAGRINTENLTRGIRWAINHQADFNIRVLSISVADDEPVSSAESAVDRAVEDAVSRGIVVVAAGGNNPARPIVPPASAPSAITVGGLDDKNEVRKEAYTIYKSTFGKTVDGNPKPDLIAPAIWVVGPILPKTDQFLESTGLFALLNATPMTVERVLARHRDHVPPLQPGLAKTDYEGWARNRINEMKYVAPYYKHVDGTSFAAPIVSSVVTQMLEANPRLTPQQIKQILTQTAEPIGGIPRDQQGHGVLKPRRAVERALEMRT